MPVSSRSRAPGWQIGTLRGAPIYLGRTWPLIAVVIVVFFGPQVSRALPGLGNTGYVVALAYAVLLLLSVLAHELSHAVVGQWRGYHVRAILADLWGGHTTYDSEDTSPLSSALVSVVGPLSNAILALLGWLVLPQVPDGVPRLLTLAFVWSNGFVAAFNLLPGLPLDGGFLLEALVWRVTGSRSLGLLVAGWCGRLLTVLLICWAVLWPLLQGQSPDAVRVLWCVVLAGFLWMGASGAISRGQSLRLFSRVRLADLLRPVVVAPEQTTVSQVRSDVDAAVYDLTGRIWGLATAAARHGIPPEQLSTLPLRAVAVVQPEGWVCRAAGPEDDVGQVVTAAQQAGREATCILVLDPAQQPLGLVHIADLGHALQQATGRP